MAARFLTDPAELLRAQLVSRVRAVFNDTRNGERPVPPSDNAFFERDTPIRMVHADLVSMMVGGMSALLMQMLHPHALQGVLDHSDFRTDMRGRLRRTARFIAQTTYGDRNDAERAIARVNAIHAGVTGTLPDGTAYSATDPRVLAWVHVTEATCFLNAYLRHVRPNMPAAEQDLYFEQFALVARKLGADPVPVTRAEAARLVRDIRPDLSASENTLAAAKLVLEGGGNDAPSALRPVLATAAIDLLPPFARTMLKLDPPGLAAIPANLAARAVGGTLRWAFRQ